MSRLPAPRALLRDFILPAAWLLALAVSIVAGVTLVPFHGDEVNQIYGSRDFATLFVQGRPQDLLIKSLEETPDAVLRLQHGSVGRYSVGWALYSAGLLQNHLLPPSGYQWTQRYGDNVNQGIRPSSAVLHRARIPSALFLAASVAWMFGLGNLVGGSGMAYVASGLVAVNPVVLLNGRRAMQEGSLLCFGLLTVLIAAIISQKRAAGERVSWRWWLGLVVAAGLALASKNTAVLYVAAALGWILAADVLRRDWRGALRTGARLALVSGLAIGLWLALSPGMWNEPLDRLRDLVSVRADHMGRQVRGVNNGASPLTDRLAHLVTEPFIAPPSHYEVQAWDRLEPIQREIAAYMASPLSGVQFGAFGGMLLTFCAGLGAVVGFAPRLRPPVPPVHYAGLLLWLAVNAVVLMLNPLPWQRYFLPLIPVVTLLAGVGAWALLRQSRGFAVDRGAARAAA